MSNTTDPNSRQDIPAEEVEAAIEAGGNELRKLLHHFAVEYENPYRLMRKDMTPASQLIQARQKLVDEVVELIASYIEAIIGKDEPTMGAQNEAGHVSLDDYEAAARNGLRAEQRVRLQPQSREIEHDHSK
jgi:hypothetical protein